MLPTSKDVAPYTQAEINALLNSKADTRLVNSKAPITDPFLEGQFGALLSLWSALVSSITPLMPINQYPQPPKTLSI